MAVARQPMSWLASPSPGLRVEREGPLLAAGLGLGVLLSLSTWGLRAPVLAGALLPAAAASVSWRQRRRQLLASRLAAGNLLDPQGLEGRLVRLAGRGFPPGPQRIEWQRIALLLEGIRAHAALCSELAPGAAVSLLVLLEDLCEELAPVLADLHALGASPGAAVAMLHQRRVGAFLDRLVRCRDRLQGLVDQALVQSRQTPGQPVWFPPDALSFLP